MLASAWFVTIALSLALSAGCASRNCCPTTTTYAPSAPPAFDCQVVERQAVRPDVSLVPPQGKVLSVSWQQKLCALSEQTAQCLAATNATTANLLLNEAEAVSVQPQRLGAHSHSSPLTSELLRLEATHKRNLAAAAALAAFLRLVEAEGGTDNLQRRGQEMDLMLADISHLQDRGLLSPVSKPEIEGQRVELWHRQVELRATVQQLNYQLEDLLGVEVASDARFWPQASLTVTTVTPNKDEAVNLALAHRADLAALRLAAGADSQDSVAAARTIFQLAAAGLGSSSPPPGCLVLLLHARSSEDEGAIRSQQLAVSLADRQRTVRHETLQAVVVVETRLEQIGLTRRRLEIAKQHQRATEEQQKLTAGAPSNLRKARLDVMAVEQDLLHDVIEWKLALVKLKEAQGLLAVECGYDLAAQTACPLACRR
jgi:hypothetical protein